jgi:hypothetical protein
MTTPDTAQLVRDAHDRIRDRIRGTTVPPQESVIQTVDNLLSDLVEKKAIAAGSVSSDGVRVDVTIAPIQAAEYITVDTGR